MNNLLFHSAITYNKLLNKGYHFILGRKNKTYEINLRFTKDAFFHLAGLQHLKDITFPSQNKERIYKDILSAKIPISMIENSIFYEQYQIQERISNLSFLEDMLDNNQIFFYINQHEYTKYTKINADYLCEFTKNSVTKTIPPETFYFFIVKAKILLNEKHTNIGTSYESIMELFRHKNYISP